MKQIQNYYIILLAILLTIFSFFGLLLYIVVYFVSWFLQRKDNRKVGYKNFYSKTFSFRQERFSICCERKHPYQKSPNCFVNCGWYLVKKKRFYIDNFQLRPRTANSNECACQPVGALCRQHINNNQSHRLVNYSQWVISC